MVEPGNSVVFAFDLPDVPSEFSVWGSQGAGYGCNVDPCASVLYWPLFPTPEHPERTAPPDSISAKLGTGPDLQEYGIFHQEVGYYASVGMGFLEFNQGLEINRSIDTLYLSFILTGDLFFNSAYNVFYDIDFVDLDLWYRHDRENEPPEWGLTTVSGRLYEPVGNVPLPASLLLIIGSMGAIAGLAKGKGLVSPG